MEQELKLTVPDIATWSKLLQHRLLAGKLQAAQQFDAVYHDTADCRLFRKGIGMRLRQQGSERVQTVKAKGKVAGALHQRLEWEMPVAGDLDLDGMVAMVDDADVSRALKRCKGRLQPQFEVKVERRVANLKVGKSLVEVALDEGEILADGRLAVVREMELELKRGDPAALFALAIDFAVDVSLLPEPASKAQRGYALIGYPTPSGHPMFDKDARMHEVLAQVLIHCLEGVAAATHAFMVEEEPDEALHELRVAVRRLRSALKLFDKLSTPPAAVQDDLKWLTRTLGPARDWEVLDRQTMPSLESELGRSMDLEQLEVLLQSVQETSSAARGQALEAAGGPRLGSLLLRLHQWVEGFSLDASLQNNAGEGVHRLLKNLRSKLKRRQKGIGNADARKLHRLRLAGKQSRYAHEFFGDMLPERRNRRYLKRLVSMQETLGRFNDQIVARELLRQVSGPQLEAPRQFLLGYLTSHTQVAVDRKTIKKRIQGILDIGLPVPR